MNYCIERCPFPPQRGGTDHASIDASTGPFPGLLPVAISLMANCLLAF